MLSKSAQKIRSTKEHGQTRLTRLPATDVQDVELELMLEIWSLPVGQVVVHVYSSYKKIQDLPGKSDAKQPPIV